MTKELKPCHRCGADDYSLSVESNISMRLSQISCGECGYLLQKSLPEEDLIQLWNTRADIPNKRITELEKQNAELQQNNTKLLLENRALK